MCSNYRPVTSMDRMLTFFGVEREMDGKRSLKALLTLAAA